jgi:enoyl-CoA hydratase/carnithine racemase
MTVDPLMQSKVAIIALNGPEARNAIEDAREGAAAFAEKRAPIWQGR